MQEDLILQISNRLKDVRKEKNVTLQELADRAGVSKSLLSQVENSRTVPSLPVLISLVRSLEIDLNEFFRDIDEQSRPKVLFKKTEEYHSFEKENAIGFFYQRMFASSVKDQHVDFVILRLDKDAKRPLVTTDAYEFKYLIKGKVEYIIGNDHYVMEEGDSLFFDASEPHNPINIGDEEAIMLVIYFFK